MGKKRARNRAIVLVTRCLERGGTELQLLMLARGLLNRRCIVTLFSIEGGSLEVEARRMGVRTVIGGYDRFAPEWKKVFLLLRSFWRLSRVIVGAKPSVVQGHLPLGNLYAVLAGRMLRVPLVITCRRALNLHQERVFGWRFIDMLSARLSHWIVVNARAVKEDTLRREGGDPEKILVIYNGIEVSRFREAQDAGKQVRAELRLPGDAQVLIIVANLLPYKGHVDLLRALSRLMPEFPDLCLLAVGEDRGYGRFLRNEAERLRVAHAVHWLGMREDVPRFLAAADVYVSASHEEGFSNALLEALAMGKAVVATRVGGNPEMLEGGRLGVLVKAGDDAALADALRALLRDHGFMRTLGKQASEWIAVHYTPKYMVDRYCALYAQVWGGDGG